MFRRSLVLLAFVSLLSLSFAFAQKTGGGQRGPANAPSNAGSGSATPGVGGLGTPIRTLELVVHVVLPNDHPAGEYIPVRLEVASGGVVGDAYTNNEGQARFPNLRPGTYIVRINGGGSVKETTSESIILDNFDSNRHEYIHAEPADANAATAVRSTQGSVSAVDLNIPSKARKEFEKGNEAFAKNEIEKAVEHYNKATELYPKYAMAYNNLGAVYMKSSDKAHAREAWNKALEADPNLVTANANIGRLDLMEEHYTDAIPPLEKALAAQPKSGEVLMLMSQAQFLAGHYDQALLYARKVHEVDQQKFGLAHLIAGRVLEMQNHPDQARIEYEVLLKENPADKEAAEARQSLTRLDSMATKR